MDLEAMIDSFNEELKTPVSLQLKTVDKELAANERLKASSSNNQKELETIVPDLQNTLVSLQDTMNLNETRVDARLSDITASCRASLAEKDQYQTADRLKLATESSKLYESAVETIDIENEINAYRVQNDHSQGYMEQIRCLEILDQICMTLPKGKMTSQTIEDNWNQLERMLQDYNELKLIDALDYELIDDLILPVPLSYNDERAEQPLPSEPSSALWPPAAYQSQTLDTGHIHS